MKLNGIEVVERHNHPGTLTRTVLRSSFLNNGGFQDLYDISSVSLFYKAQNTSPSTILASATQTISDEAASSVRFRWTLSSGEILDASVYGSEAAKQPYIYKTGTGQYAVVLDGTQTVTSEDRFGNSINNQASSTGTYIDVWTVKLTETSDWTIFIHELTLFQDSIISLTEPLLLKSKTSLTPNKVRLGEVIDLKVPTEITVMNRNIDQSIKNTLSTGILKDAQFRILKHNEDSNLPAWVEVSGYADTAGDVEVTSDNTMMFSFDTAVLTSGLADLGSGTGTYSVEAKYTLLNETIISPMMYFTVR